MHLSYKRVHLFLEAAKMASCSLANQRILGDRKAAYWYGVYSQCCIVARTRSLSLNIHVAY